MTLPVVQMKLVFDDTILQCSAVQFSVAITKAFGSALYMSLASRALLLFPSSLSVIGISLDFHLYFLASY